MIEYVIAAACIILGYISGSVNYAIIITKLATGKDIRNLGNKNPGTSNVMREVGKFWGILVSICDALKGLIPMILMHWLFFREYNNFNFAVIYLTGIAAILGHCHSIFLRLKGGGGIGTMQGVVLFFVPVEYIFAMLISGIIVLIFFRNADKKFGQKTPIFFVTLLPFVTLGTALWIKIPLFLHLSIGGHLPSVVICTFIMSLMLLAINAKFLKTKVRRK